MLVRFFGISGTADDARRYLVEEAGRENSPPFVIDGNIDRTVNLTNGISRKHKYTSGVISFHRGDNPTPDDLRDVIKDFKAHFFAGLAPDQFDITFVQHSHLGRIELHFVTPRVELLSGKDLNIAPPNMSHAFKERFVQAWNFTKGWADPGDPSRARLLSEPPPKEGHGYKLLGTKLQITEYLAELTNAGAVVDRASIVQALEAVGLKVTRQGDDYLSVKTEDGTSIRLKGSIYKKDWTYAASIQRQAEGDNGEKPYRNRDDDAVRAESAWADVEKYRARRAEENRRRYPRPGELFEPSRTVDMDFCDRLRRHSTDLLTLSLQPELIPRPDHRGPVEPGRSVEPDARPTSEPAGGVILRDTGGDVSHPSHANTLLQQQSLPEDRRVTDVGPDQTREGSSAYVAAAARDLVELRDAALQSAAVNRGATDRVRDFVEDCVIAVRAALGSVKEAVKSWFSSPSSPEKKDEPPRRNRSEPGEAPGF